MYDQQETSNCVMSFLLYC